MELPNVVWAGIGLADAAPWVSTAEMQEESNEKIASPPRVVLMIER